MVEERNNNVRTIKTEKPSIKTTVISVCYHYHRSGYKYKDCRNRNHTLLTKCFFPIKQHENPDCYRRGKGGHKSPLCMRR